MSDERGDAVQAQRIMNRDIVTRVLSPRAAVLVQKATEAYWPHHNEKSIPIDAQGYFSPVATDEF